MASHREQPSHNNWYDPGFDKDLGDKLVDEVQEVVGCFECGASSPKLRCSRCKLAKYCNPNCQKVDWKKTHKSLCKTYLESRAANVYPEGDAVPILLKSVGLISEAMFVDAMRQRRDSFLNLALKSSSQNPVTMNFTCSVVDMFDKLRIVADATFVVLVDNKKQKTVTPHILVEVVDDDPAAIKACHQTGGNLSDATFAKVVDTLATFYGQLRKSNISLMILACGNGLVTRLDELKHKLETKGISGVSLIPTVTF